MRRAYAVGSRYVVLNNGSGKLTAEGGDTLEFKYNVETDDVVRSTKMTDADFAAIGTALRRYRRSQAIDKEFSE